MTEHDRDQVEDLVASFTGTREQVQSGGRFGLSAIDMSEDQIAQAIRLIRKTGPYPESEYSLTCREEGRYAHFTIQRRILQ